METLSKLINNLDYKSLTLLKTAIEKQLEIIEIKEQLKNLNK